MSLFRRKQREKVQPPEPKECGERGWRTWMLCDLPLGHNGKHGTITGRSTKSGAFVKSTSVTREMWT